MSGSFDNYQVLYSDGPPTSDIRLGQLLVDESEPAPLDMLKICTSLGPPVYTSLSTGISANILASNNVWTGTNEFDNDVIFDELVTHRGTSPEVRWNETDAPADETIWAINHSLGFLQIFTRTDAGAVGDVALRFNRTGATATDITLLQDNLELRFGAGGDDLAIYHDGANNQIDSNTGTLNINDSGVRGLTVGAGFSLVPGTASTPTLCLGGAFTGIGSGGSTSMDFYINNSSAATRTLMIQSGFTKMTGTSDATQPSSRFAHFTTDMGTERGYWGFPTTGSDTMILRNIAGTTLQLRCSANTNVMSLSDTGVAFNGASIVAPPNYTVTNPPAADRTFDGSAAAAAEVRAVLATLVADLIATGLLS